MTSRLMAGMSSAGNIPSGATDQEKVMSKILLFFCIKIKLLFNGVQNFVHDLCKYIFKYI